MKTLKQLPLRKGVGVVLLNYKNDIFVGKRIDNPKKFWQMPQGGVEKDESFVKAAKRELLEETGVKSVKILKELDGWFEYNLPNHLLGKIWKGKYRGQKQKWFVMRFLGENSEINIKNKKPEFLDWKWIHLSDLTKVVVNFKLDLYQKIEKKLKLLNLN